MPYIYPFKTTRKPTGSARMYHTYSIPVNLHIQASSDNILLLPHRAECILSHMFWKQDKSGLSPELKRTLRESRKWGNPKYDQKRTKKEQKDQQMIQQHISHCCSNPQIAAILTEHNANAADLNVMFIWARNSGLKDQVSKKMTADPGLVNMYISNTSPSKSYEGSYWRDIDHNSCIEIIAQARRKHE